MKIHFELWDKDSYNNFKNHGEIWLQPIKKFDIEESCAPGEGSLLRFPNSFLNDSEEEDKCFQVFSVYRSFVEYQHNKERYENVLSDVQVKLVTIIAIPF